MSSSCPRCGHIAAADGHATLDEWQQCVDDFAFAQQLTKWTTEWISTSGHEQAAPISPDRRLTVDCSQQIHHQYEQNGH